MPNPPHGRGRSTTKFSYTYEDISKVLNCSAMAVRKHAQRGNFNPKDLVSVLEFIHKRLEQELIENKSKK